MREKKRVKLQNTNKKKAHQTQCNLNTRSKNFEEIKMDGTRQSLDSEEIAVKAQNIRRIVDALEGEKTYLWQSLKMRAKKWFP